MGKNSTNQRRHRALLKHPPLSAHAPSPGFVIFEQEISGGNLSSGLGWIAVPGLTPGPGLADVEVVMILLPGRCPPFSTSNNNSSLAF